MDSNRIRLYDELEKQIGNTPLVQYFGEVPNGNRIWIKRECDNPFGSHYDRVYLALYKDWEEKRGLKPGSNVLETTSGTAGVSFSGIGSFLGYNCFVMLPDCEGLEKRKESIEREGGTVLLTPGDYVNGFTKERIVGNMKKYNAAFLNHSMGSRGTNNEVTLSSLEGITRETLEGIDIDYFIPAVGNGSSVLGPGRILDHVRVIGFESVQSAVAYSLLHPGEYEKKFGITPGTLSRHKLPGTSYQGIDFPHIRESVESVLDEVVLISDSDMDEEYERLTGQNVTRSLPHWNMDLVNHEDLGRSSKAGLAVALEITKSFSEKNLLIIGYDKIERY